MATESEDAIAPAVREVLDLFEERADTLRFPDVDHDSLEVLRDRVQERVAAWARARMAQEAAREALAAEQLALRNAAARGLAYAQVFAEADSELREALASYALCREESAPRRGARPRRARRSKASDTGVERQKPSELPFDSEVVAAKTA
jgi:hypothetical protein